MALCVNLRDKYPGSQGTHEKAGTFVSLYKNYTNTKDTGLYSDVVERHHPKALLFGLRILNKFVSFCKI
jgi:hypothetical protein